MSNPWVQPNPRGLGWVWLDTRNGLGWIFFKPPWWVELKETSQPNPCTPLLAIGF